TTWSLCRTHKIVVARTFAASSGAWMGIAINLFQTIHADMSIALRGREARMAEHLLDRAQVGIGIEHVRRERMAQPMGRHRGVESGLDNSPRDDLLDTARAEPRT